MAREREEGLAAMQRGDLPTAAILLEQVVRQNKEDFESHLYLGGVYHQMKRHGDAARVLTRATELQPDSAQAHFNLGIAQEQSGDLEGAQASFERAILLQAEYPVAHEALERVQSRLNGPSLSVNEAATPTVETLPETASPLVEDKPAFSRPVNSSFGSAAPASAPSPAAASDYTPASSATPVFPAESGRPNAPASPAAPSTPYGATAYGAPSASSAPGSSPDASGTPTGEPANPYAPSPPGYGPPYAPPYGQAPMPGQSAPYGQPPAYGHPAPPGTPPPYGQPPYGQPPYGPGYAPPGVYGYGGAQQYVVVQQPVPQEATIALILSILGLPVVCTGLGIVFSPISLFLALKARRMMQADPSLGGQGTVTAALWLSWIGLGLNILVWIAFIIAMFAGIS